MTLHKYVAIMLFAMAALAAASTHEPGADPIGPNVSLSPDEVVKIQLEALRSNDDNDGGIAQCFAFASPKNKAGTGPLERFGRMIKEGPYSLMLRYREAEFGELEIKDDRFARQRVTLTDPSESITYMFYLSRQSDPECDGCWMTDAVNIIEVQSPV